MKKTRLSVLALAAALLLGIFCSCQPSSNEIVPTEGLEYVLREDGTYAVGVGTATEESEIIVSSSVEGIPVTAVMDSGFADCVKLEAIRLPDRLVEIGDSAFAGCTVLHTVAIPMILTQTVGDHAFAGCTSLTEIVIPGTLLHVGIGVFDGCTQLKKADLPGNYTAIGERFYADCAALETVTVPESVRDVSDNAFSGCESLVFNEFGNALYLGNAANRYALLFKAKSTEITSCEVSVGAHVIYRQAFDRCADLTEVVFPDYAPGGIGTPLIAEGGTFPGMIILPEGITAENGGTGDPQISILITRGLWTVGNAAFRGCVSLSEIALPFSVEKIGDGAFSGCTGLTEIVFDQVGSSTEEGPTPPALSKIGAGALEGCSALKDVIFRGDREAWDGVTKGEGWDADTGDYTVFCSDDEPAEEE